MSLESAENPFDSLLECSSEREGFSNLQIAFRCIAIPAVCCLGLLCNLINTLVFAQKSMRKQTFNLFFLALSISDAVVLITALIVFCLPAIAELLDYLPLINVSSRLVVVFYPIGQTALTSSVYLTVMVALHRFVAIVHPFVATIYGYSTKTISAVIGVVLTFSVIFNITRWMELTVSLCVNGFKQIEVELWPTDLMMNRNYTIFYRNTAYTIIQFFLPFVILSFLNLKIVSAVRNSEKFSEGCESHAKKEIYSVSSRENRTSIENEEKGRASPHPGTPKDDKKKPRTQARDINRMLMTITSLFLCFNILGLLNNGMEVLQIRYPFFETPLIETASLLVNINAASTTIVYWWFSTKFRGVVKKCLYHNFGFEWCKPEGIFKKHPETKRPIVTKYSQKKDKYSTSTLLN